MDNQNYNLNYNANYNPAPQQEQSKKPSIVAMVFGIIAATLCWIPYVSIGGIVFGIIGSIKCKNERARNVPQTHGFLLSGSICSKVGIIAGAIMTVIYLILLIVSLTTYSRYYY